MIFKTQNLRDSFIHDLTLNIGQSYNNCIQACPTGYDPQEPDFIAFLVRDLTNDIPVLIQKFCPFAVCQTQGIFCHQSPKVKFNNPKPNQKNCAELGDLLIVFTETINNQFSKSTALLLQAKCVSSTPHEVGINEQHQLYLYENWPTFTYSSPSELKNQSRSIKAIQNSEGSNYLLFSKNQNVITHTYVTSIPNQSLSCRYALASAIGKMFNFESDSGRIFIPSISFIPGDDWSNMINDIIKIAKIRCFNRNRIGIHNQSRYFCLGFLNNNPLNDEISLPIGGYVDSFSDESIEINEDDISGISTLLIYIDVTNNE